jgi:tripartite-type tricarboxylate transporter receptor subunit TctC
MFDGNWLQQLEGNMTLHRRRFLALAASTAALPALPHPARAETYPSQPVRIVTSFPAGNVDDLLARSVGQSLSERLGQPFTLDNQPIAKAAEALRDAPRDGYTLVLVTAANVLAAILDEKLNFSFVRDAAPVSGISRNPFFMVVNPSLPAKTVPEFIAYAKANPGKVNMASGGNGSILRLAGELFQTMSKATMVHVPYQGAGPAVAAVISGEAHVLFATLPMAIEPIRAGKLRALAVTTAMRSQVLPDVPTVGDFVPGYEASGIQGLWAPKGIPSEVTDKLNNAINAALADPKFKEHVGEFGNTLLPGSTAEYGKTMVNETEKWTQVIRTAGIKPG